MVKMANQKIMNKAIDRECGYFNKFILQYPQFQTKEFELFIVENNKAKLNVDQLNSISIPELLRLTRIYIKKKTK